jgi:hypothetical protein
MRRKQFNEEIRHCKDMDVSIVVKKRGKASSKTRRYYFGVVVKEITIELKRLGNDVDEVLVHEMLKLNFNKQYIRNADGEVIGEIGDTTTDHNPEERSEYIDRCIRFASEKLEITIPSPGEQVKMFE